MRRLFELIVSPSEEIYRMSRTRLGWGGAGIIITASLSCVIAMSLVTGIDGRAGSLMLSWGLVARAIILTVIIFISAALYHYFAGIMGGSSNPARTFRGLLYTLAPLCFLAPLALISRAWLGRGIYFLFIPVILVYTAFLQFKLISYFYGLSSSKAVAVLIFPWIIFSLSAFLLVMVLGFGIISALI